MKTVIACVYALSFSLILVSCEDPDLERSRKEITRLHNVITMMDRENAALSKTVPSEQPAVLAELDAAKKQILELRGQIASMNAALAQAKEATKGEVLPLSAWMKSIDMQMADHNARINACSKRGHTHSETTGKYSGNTGPD